MTAEFGFPSYNEVGYLRNSSGGAAAEPEVTTYVGACVNTVAIAARHELDIHAKSEVGVERAAVDGAAARIACATAVIIPLPYIAT